jgi:hypothetical protein
MDQDYEVSTREYQADYCSLCPRKAAKPSTTTKSTTQIRGV